ncbi:MAG: hypothetical protein IKU67_05660 [Firmicutes bacterium]|nr:hypothetical protein [Bacillota bacterium]
MNNQTLVNMIMNMRDLDIAVDALFKGSKKLVRATKANKTLIFLSAITFGTLLYAQDKQVKKLEKRIAKLEYEFTPNVSEPCEEFEEDEE